jgi:hypothetical protein
MQAVGLEQRRLVGHAFEHEGHQRRLLLRARALYMAKKRSV